MKKKIYHLLPLYTLMFCFFSTPVMAANIQSAQELKHRLQNVRAQVERILSASGTVPLMVINEEDTQALSRLASANISLEQAAVLAEQSELAFSALNFNLGNYQFVRSCSQAAISRSRVARANLLANLPPVGFLAAFSPDMGAIVDELQDLKVDVGCP